ncbi:hypothetical protein ACFV9E_06515 [Streptomyces sp. NPDC059835]|uniref:hypothetical protein n=1 Tax=Streptomyces sp. NPDC059835 TaxID=3346967 RepID=UPI003657B3AE
MSNIMPDPWFEPLDEFDVLMSQNQMPHISAFTSLYDEAYELLLATRPDGFEPEEIGELAFEALPEAEKATAMQELFYTYWSGRELDRQAIARYEAQGGAR